MSEKPRVIRCDRWTYSAELATIDSAEITPEIRARAEELGRRAAAMFAGWPPSRYAIDELLGRGP